MVGSGEVRLVEFGSERRHTNVPRIEEGEDCADGKDVVILVQRHLVCVWRKSAEDWSCLRR